MALNPELKKLLAEGVKEYSRQDPMANVIPLYPAAVELLEGRDALVCDVADEIAEAFDGPPADTWELAERIVTMVERGAA
jgi:hypothetical protein